MRRMTKKKGFTLVELIVVIAIIGVLTAVAVPRISKFKEDATIKANNASAAVIGKAAEAYIASQPTIPASLTLTDIASYLDDETAKLSGVNIEIVNGSISVNGPGEGKYPLSTEVTPKN